MDSADAVRGRQRSRDWERLDHGLYWKRSWPDVQLEELAARSLVLPRSAAFSHLTAARTYGWWLPAPIDHPIFVAQSTADGRARRQGMFVCRHPQPFPMVVCSGVRLAAPAEVILSCSRDLGVLDLVVLGDSALRNQNCSVADLWRSARQRRRGAPLLRTVIPLLDARSESPWESIMRVLYGAAEIPVEPQYVVRDPRSGFVARADFRVIGTNHLHEYDGAGHRNGEVHAGDLTRARHLLGTGWVRVGFTSTDLLRDGRRIIADADRLLGRPWSRDRVDAWEQLIDQSLFDPRFRARAHRRWRQPPVTDE
ncbi:MAG: hypothetical protein ACR2LI_12250 [Propionibacteriaceae bacterium]